MSIWEFSAPGWHDFLLPDVPLAPDGYFEPSLIENPDGFDYAAPRASLGPRLSLFRGTSHVASHAPPPMTTAALLEVEETVEEEDNDSPKIVLEEGNHVPTHDVASDVLVPSSAPSIMVSNTVGSSNSISTLFSPLPSTPPSMRPASDISSSTSLPAEPPASSQKRTSPRLTVVATLSAAKPRTFGSEGRVGIADQAWNSLFTPSPAMSGGNETPENATQIALPFDSSLSSNLASAISTNQSNSTSYLHSGTPSMIRPDQQVRIPEQIKNDSLSGEALEFCGIICSELVERSAELSPNSFLGSPSPMDCQNAQSDLNTAVLMGPTPTLTPRSATKSLISSAGSAFTRVPTPTTAGNTSQIISPEPTALFNAPVPTDSSLSATEQGNQTFQSSLSPASSAMLPICFHGAQESIGGETPEAALTIPLHGSMDSHKLENDYNLDAHSVQPSSKPVFVKGFGKALLEKRRALKNLQQQREGCAGEAEFSLLTGLTSLPRLNSSVEIDSTMSSQAHMLAVATSQSTESQSRVEASPLIAPSTSAFKEVHHNKASQVGIITTQPLAPTREITPTPPVAVLPPNPLLSNAIQCAPLPPTETPNLVPLTFIAIPPHQKHKNPSTAHLAASIPSIVGAPLFSARERKERVPLWQSKSSGDTAVTHATSKPSAISRSPAKTVSLVMKTSEVVAAPLKSHASLVCTDVAAVTGSSNLLNLPSVGNSVIPAMQIAAISRGAMASTAQSLMKRKVTGAGGLFSAPAPSHLSSKGAAIFIGRQAALSTTSTVTTISPPIPVSTPSISPPHPPGAIFDISAAPIADQPTKNPLGGQCSILSLPKEELASAPLPLPAPPPPLPSHIAKPLDVFSRLFVGAGETRRRPTGATHLAPPTAPSALSLLAKSVYAAPLPLVAKSPKVSPKKSASAIPPVDAITAGNFKGSAPVIPPLVPGKANRRGSFPGKTIPNPFNFATSARAGVRVSKGDGGGTTTGMAGCSSSTGFPKNGL